jgi:putative transcriptional regulator
MKQGEKMQVTTKKVASRIKQNRIEAELTQQELADFAGVDRKTINRIENGHFSPNIETLLRISTALGVKPESMFASA